jgi:uncharacterized membrane protein
MHQGVAEAAPVFLAYLRLRLAAGVAHEMLWVLQALQVGVVRLQARLRAGQEPKGSMAAQGEQTVAAVAVEVGLLVPQEALMVVLGELVQILQ